MVHTTDAGVSRTRSLNIYIYYPPGNEEHEVLQTGSIHGAILLSCLFLYNRAF